MLLESPEAMESPTGRVEKNSHIPQFTHSSEDFLAIEWQFHGAQRPSGILTSRCVYTQEGRECEEMCSRRNSLWHRRESTAEQGTYDAHEKQHITIKKKEVLILSIYWKRFLIFMCELSGGIFCINASISKKGNKKKKNHLSSNTLKIINRKNPHRKQSLKNERNKRNDWNHNNKCSSDAPKSSFKCLNRP